MSDVGRLSETATGGDRLATLRALRDRLAAEIDGCESARDVAALSQRLMDVLAQIEAVEKTKPQAKGTPADEVAKRRAERKAAPARPRGAAQRGE